MMVTGEYSGDVVLALMLGAATFTVTFLVSSLLLTTVLRRP
jgi:hypothetical protein